MRSTKALTNLINHAIIEENYTHEEVINVLRSLIGFHLINSSSKENIHTNVTKFVSSLTYSTLKSFEDMNSQNPT